MHAISDRAGGQNMQLYGKLQNQTSWHAAQLFVVVIATSYTAYNCNDLDRTICMERQARQARKARQARQADQHGSWLTGERWNVCA